MVAKAERVARQLVMETGYADYGKKTRVYSTPVVQRSTEGAPWVAVGQAGDIAKGGAMEEAKRDESGGSNSGESPAATWVKWHEIGAMPN